MNNHNRVAVSVLVLVGLFAASCSSANNSKSLSINVVKSRQSPTVSGLGTIQPVGDVHVLAGPMGQYGGAPRIKTILVKEGDRVSKNQTLVIFDNSAEFASERSRIAVSITSKKIEIDLLRAQINRFEYLTKAGAYPMADLEEKKVRLASFHAQLRELEGTLRTYDERILPGTVIRAPISAVALKINNRVGERVHQSGVIEIGNIDRMQAVLDIDEGDIELIRTGQAVTVNSENGAFRESLQGSVSSIGLIVKGKKRLSVDPALDSDSEERVIEVKVMLDPKSSQRTRQLTGVKVVGVIAVSQ
jgi:HlyD family secretion protein